MTNDRSKAGRWLVLAALAAAGCGNGAGGATDANTSETSRDGATGGDSMMNAEAGREAGPMEEAGAEAGPMEEAGAEAGPTEEAGAEAGPTEEAGAEAGPTEEAGAEAGPDAPVMGDDAGPEGGAAEAGPEAGSGEAGAGEGGTDDAGSGCATGMNLCTSGGMSACADLQTDPQNCGMCGRVCMGGQTCTEGTCGCATGSTTCGASCVNTMTDTANCGMCGRACAAGQACVAGACACAMGTMACGATCVDAQSDNANCGMCGNACPTGRTCVAGACACPMGQTSCGTGATATCENTQSDNANCGACGNACPMGRTCVMGACACPMGQTSCGTGAAAACVNTGTDNANCGACGMACTGGATCNGGMCTCPTGQTRCGTGAAAACTDTATDSANCGACGTACPSGQVCSMGMCRSTCMTPTVPCGTGASMVCANTQNDDQNCGACGTVCRTVPNSFGGLCTTGTCRPICTSGFANCNSMYADGCEVNTTNNVSNCGSCGNTCPTTAGNATGVTCASSRCTPTCNAPTATEDFRDCNTSVADGCETNVLTNTNNCGSCGNVCPAGLGCFNGLCTPRSCNELHTARPTLPSGEYDIDTDGTGPNPIIRVYCDMTTDGGGWTLIGTVHNGAQPAADVRRWDTLAAFTSNTTFGSIANRTADDFKSPAWGTVPGNDLLVVTDSYHFGFRGLLGNRAFGPYINAGWPTACNTTWARSGADFVSSNLTTNQQRLFGFALRGFDNNASCFPGGNENTAVSFMAATCCWVNGLGNNPGGGAGWPGHDVALPTPANIRPVACSGGWPCNANMLAQNGSGQSYDRSTKVAYALVWVR